MRFFACSLVRQSTLIWSRMTWVRRLAILSLLMLRRPGNTKSTRSGCIPVLSRPPKKVAGPRKIRTQTVKIAIANIQHALRRNCLQHSPFEISCVVEESQAPMFQRRKACSPPRPSPQRFTTNSQNLVIILAPALESIGMHTDLESTRKMSVSGDNAKTKRTVI